MRPHKRKDDTVLFLISAEDKKKCMFAVARTSLLIGTDPKLFFRENLQSAICIDKKNNDKKAKQKQN